MEWWKQKRGCWPSFKVGGGSRAGSLIILAGVLLEGAGAASSSTNFPIIHDQGISQVEYVSVHDPSFLRGVASTDGPSAASTASSLLQDDDRDDGQWVHLSAVQLEFLQSINGFP